MNKVDAVVVGSGPNGMAAAVTLARAGLAVRVHEALPHIGGGAATGELTLPGFRHDWGSAVHPMAFASPFFRAFELERRVDFAVPDISYGHPLDGGRAALAHRSLAETAAGLGRDGEAWRRLFSPLVDGVEGVIDFTSGGLLRLPKHPIAAAWFGARTAEQGLPTWNLRFRGDRAPALLSGVAAHSVGRLPSLATSGAGLTLAVHAHVGGWPVPIGGSGAIIEAMADDFRAHGGEIVVDSPIRDLRELDSPRVVLFDTSPRAMLEIAGAAFPEAYRRSVGRFRYGNAVAKLDFALSAPVPWTNEGLRRTATLHLGGSRAEIAAGERDVARGVHPRSPYALVSQPSLFDDTRAPAGSHTLWAYTHVPRFSDQDVSERVIAQIERFAPGFRDTILDVSYRTAQQVQAWNANYIGGDIFSGAVTLPQLLKRPTIGVSPWSTPARGVYLCSSSTPPGPGVHGLPGWHAAVAALKKDFGMLAPELGIEP